MRTFRLTQANIGHEPPVRPETPVPDAITSEGMNPYRGFDPHGVEQVAIPHPVQNIEDKTILHFDLPKPEADPIPVRIVAEGGREIRDWLNTTEYATNVARQIVPQNHDRSRISIANTGTQVVWLGRTVNVSVNSGYPLAPNEKINWDIETAIFAVSNDGSQQQIQTVSFFVIPLDAAHSVRPGS